MAAKRVARKRQTATGSKPVAAKNGRGEKLTAERAAELLARARIDLANAIAQFQATINYLLEAAAGS